MPCKVFGISGLYIIEHLIKIYYMNSKNLIFPILSLGALFMLPACSDNDDNSLNTLRPTALVTVCPNTDGTFMMQLDNTTQLIPTNLSTSPFGKKEVRALVNYTEATDINYDEHIRKVHVNWMDSIRTKMPVATAGEENDLLYGNDPIEIVNDWVTIAEDGYLTMRIRTLWGSPGARHYINLVSGTNPDNPFEFVLRHNAQGDTYGEWGDALIAFNLNKLEVSAWEEPLSITLKWQSFSGEKSADFKLQLRPRNNISIANTTNLHTLE